MNTPRDLLPWILGGLSAAAVAVGITLVSASRTQPSGPPAVHARATMAAPMAVVAPASASTPAPVARRLISSQPEQVATPTAVHDPAPVSAGQIWQCTTNGVKTFSNNPCGEKSSLLEVGPINSMPPPPPAMNFARHYAPQPSAAPASNDQSDEGDQDAYADEPTGETGASSYSIVRGIRIEHRRRPDRSRRPPALRSAPVSRKY